MVEPVEATFAVVEPVETIFAVVEPVETTYRYFTSYITLTSLTGTAAELVIRYNLA